MIREFFVTSNYKNGNGEKSEASFTSGSTAELSTVTFSARGEEGNRRMRLKAFFYFHESFRRLQNWTLFDGLEIEWLICFHRNYSFQTLERFGTCMVYGVGINGKLICECLMVGMGLKENVGNLVVFMSFPYFKQPFPT